MSLQHLIAEAVKLGGLDLCSTGHSWESEGGRPCPYESLSPPLFQCSQTVYRCTRCGEYDYGKVGGPAYAECSKFCSLE